MEKNTIKICTCHEEEIPLIWTFAFNGSEYWCPACGFNGGMFGSGTDVEATKELIAVAKEWKKKTNKFLEAKSTLVCSSMKYKGKQTKREDLPPDFMDKNRKIVSEYKYILNK